MEKRIGSVLMVLRDKSLAPQMNQIISEYSDIIIGRQGLPVHSTGDAIISLVLEGTTDEIGALTGKLGRLKGLAIKSAVLKLDDWDRNSN